MDIKKQPFFSRFNFSEVVQGILFCETEHAQCSIKESAGQWRYVIYGKRSVFGYVKDIANAVVESQEAAIQAATGILKAPYTVV